MYRLQGLATMLMLSWGKYACWLLLLDSYSGRWISDISLIFWVASISLLATPWPCCSSHNKRAVYTAVIDIRISQEVYLEVGSRHSCIELHYRHIAWYWLLGLRLSRHIFGNSRTAACTWRRHESRHFQFVYLAARRVTSHDNFCQLRASLLMIRIAAISMPYLLRLPWKPYCASRASLLCRQFRAIIIITMISFSFACLDKISQYASPSFFFPRCLLIIHQLALISSKRAELLSPLAIATLTCRHHYHKAWWQPLIIISSRANMTSTGRLRRRY